MALITRNAKGSPLTWTEMDDNLSYLEGQSDSSDKLPLTGGTMTGPIELDDLKLNNEGLIKTDTINGLVSTIGYVSGNIVTIPVRNPIYIDTFKSNSGIGSGLTMMIITVGGNYVFNILEEGSGYLANDELVISGTYIMGGTDGIDDITIKIDTIDDKVLGSGIKFENNVNDMESNIYFNNDETVSLTKRGDDFIFNSIDTTGPYDTNHNFGFKNSPFIGKVLTLDSRNNDTNVGQRIYFDTYSDILYLTVEGNYQSTIGIGDGYVNITANQISLGSYILKLPNLPTAPDNVTAISNGLVEDQVYKTSTGELRIVV